MSTKEKKIRHVLGIDLIEDGSVVGHVRVEVLGQQVELVVTDKVDPQSGGVVCLTLDGLAALQGLLSQAKSLVIKDKADER